MTRDALPLPGHRHSPEFDLVRACCRWPDAVRDTESIRRLAAHADWSRVEAIAHRHRVAGLVASGLHESGVAIPPDLNRRAKRLHIANHRMIAETIRIDRAFAAAGIDRLFVKGLTLAMLAYGDPRVKMSLDIDMLVRLDDIACACALLAGLGYVRQVPGADIPDAGLREWVVHFKETAWRHPVFGVTVDLHARLTSNPLLLPDVGLESPRACVTIAPGHAVATLAREPLFLYLCAHGAETGWSRLKWTADLAALATALGPVEVERLYRHAVRSGVGRCVAQGLLLASDLLALDLGPLNAELRHTRMPRLLAWLAGTSLRGRHEIAPHRHDTIAGIPILLSQALLRPGLRYQFAELALKFANPRDRARSRLPARLTWLYPILSAGRLLRRGLPSARK